ncbi:MAG: hypothetical protein ACIAXF_05850 [Phycisphaerales bacterium JB063]
MPASDASAAPYAPEVTVWADDEHADEVARLLDLMGQSIHPIAVGGPRGGAPGGLAKSLNVPGFDDLRQMLVERPGTFLLLAVSQDESPADLAAALAGGTTLLALEPTSTTLAGYAELDRPARNGEDPAIMPGRLVLLPRFTHSPGFIAAPDPYDILGDRRSLSITTLGGKDDGSLFMRLHDAWATALVFCDLPETIHASTAPPAGHTLEGPRNLAGRVSAHAQCPGGCAVLLFAANQSPAPQHTLTILGDTGQLTVTPTGYQLTRHDGTIEDEKKSTPVPSRIDQSAEQWRRLIDQRASTDEPGTRREQAALACTLATLLSAKTGQPESPQRVMQMSKG